MKCQILFSGKTKKNIINLQSADFAHCIVSVKIHKFSTEVLPVFLTQNILKYTLHFIKIILFLPILVYILLVFSNDVHKFLLCLFFFFFFFFFLTNRHSLNNLHMKSQLLVFDQKNFIFHYRHI